LFATLGYDEKSAMANRDALKKGEFGLDIDYAFGESKEVIKIDKDTNAKSFMVLGRFEACDVVFDRVAIFYSNEKQVVINVNADGQTLAQQMPQYFKVDPSKCKKPIGVKGDVYFWKEGGKAQFIKDLKAGRAPSPAQTWYAKFDEVIEGIDLE
jgi:hypothetical protein